MGHATTATAHAPGRTAPALIRRAAWALTATYADLANSLAESRRDHQVRQAMHDLDRRLLQDLGLDRGAC